MTRASRVVDEVLGLYAAGWFPMDDEPDAEVLPFYAVQERAVLELHGPGAERRRRRTRRSTQRGEREGWRHAWDVHFEQTLTACARPRRPGDGFWITPRLAALYRLLHEAGYAHSAEVLLPDGRPAAGILCVRIGSAAFLESMYHAMPHAGTCNLQWTLDALAAEGTELCDIQLTTAHTLRLGASLIPRAEYERRLAAACAHP